MEHARPNYTNDKDKDYSAKYRWTIIGNLDPFASWVRTYGRITMETYEPMSSAGVKMKCGRITEMNILVSRVESLQPGQECGPSENDMTFAIPGCNGARALSGKFDQRSGLKRCQSLQMVGSMIRTTYLNSLASLPQMSSLMFNP
jgi:hypothetical protein